MKIAEMMPSKYLKKEDVGRGVLVTIKALSKANVAMENEPPEFKYVMYFHELEKPLVLNSTNIQLCAQACGSEETDHWVGRQIVLYTDPNVSFGGKIIGGIRVRAPRQPPVAPSAVAPPAPTVPMSTPLPPSEPDDDLPW